MSNIVSRHELLYFCLIVYADLGFGFATGCLIIIVEIIYRKLTRPGRLNSGCGTILLLLTLSAILTAVTAWMVDEYDEPVKVKNYITSESEWT